MPVRLLVQPGRHLRDAHREHGVTTHDPTHAGGALAAVLGWIYTAILFEPMPALGWVGLAILAFVALKAGILGGDIIIKVDGKEIEKMEDVTDLLIDMDPGDKIKVTIVRDIIRVASVKANLLEDGFGGRFAPEAQLIDRLKFGKGCCRNRMNLGLEMRLNQMKTRWRLFSSWSST